MDPIASHMAHEISDFKTVGEKGIGDELKRTQAAA
jgi:hypothetical protein